ncbi:ABC transporter ATP-binding protein [Pseudonocardia sp. HH130629-09]|uniref:ABC transporter ATP-binding protein n=1 Tax=Pseudonocardia sp. HH130629-09 TaxID=1641402 RepID=UPI0006CB5CB2|nr:ABC transporter ATP-binding protein [Pseudonocardia sp. HH130629-09]ALE85407.1 hypothetical protein XF36_21515 [Pseudonocardia sp. HH130629-09]
MTKRLGGIVVNDCVDLDVRPGDFFGILGHNGAGKTTLVKQMVGLLRPTEGVLQYCGINVTKAGHIVCRDVGYMPQSAHALNALNVAESLLFTARLKGLRRNLAARERDRVADLLGLASLMDRTARTLSGGERRLLQVGVALVADPLVLVLDEPTNEMDPVRRRQVWELLWRLNRHEGKTVVMVTHSPREAEQVLSRVAMMDAGRVVRTGTPADLVASADGRLRLRVSMDGCDSRRRAMILKRLRTVCPTAQETFDAIVGMVPRGAIEQAVHTLERLSVHDFSLAPLGLEDVYVRELTTDGRL